MSRADWTCLVHLAITSTRTIVLWSWRIKWLQVWERVLYASDSPEMSYFCLKFSFKNKFLIKNGFNLTKIISLSRHQALRCNGRRRVYLTCLWRHLERDDQSGGGWLCPRSAWKRHENFGYSRGAVWPVHFAWYEVGFYFKLKQKLNYSSAVTEAAVIIWLALLCN